ncbi:hypothetical protein BCR39DRAFT_278948 [Naematelia encephala]|uniref:Uncharacterized protein n=1 Tax=Naematelia encephala TaxID=71784 RepID=A0A1Y2AUG1_9TREE|nr:hypothetical protein BCR39DRAFT_278948 [Naematelia encephala]
MSSGGKYIPPSKRAGYVPSPSSLPPSARRVSAGAVDSNIKTLSWDELSDHFQHPQDSTFTYFSYPLPPRPRYIRREYDPSRTPETTPLPPSPPPPPPIHPLNNIVSYICIFQNAHPAWDTDGELWTHSNADKLLEDWKGLRQNFSRPVPVFRAIRGSKSVFGFYGWWIIQDLEVVPAGSDELKRMLKVKEDTRAYGRAGRTAGAWQQSFETTWVKLRLVRAPPTGKHYTELKDPITLKGGKGGEVERYLLEISGLQDEISILDEHHEHDKTNNERTSDQH